MQVLDEGGALEGVYVIDRRYLGCAEHGFKRLKGKASLRCILEVLVQDVIGSIIELLRRGEQNELAIVELVLQRDLLRGFYAAGPSLGLFGRLASHILDLVLHIEDHRVEHTGV